MSTKKSAVKKSAKKPVIERDNSPEAKTSKFKSIASRRANVIVKTLKNLGNCSSKATYLYTDEQVAKMFAGIDSAVSACKARFAEKIKPEAEKIEL